MSDPLDVARYIFINDENELRSGWRVLTFVLFAAILEIILAGFIKTLATLFPSLKFIAAESADGENLTASGLIVLGVNSGRDFASAVVATAICARWFERRSFGSVGLRRHKGWLKDFALGSLMGSSALAVAVGIAAMSGALIFDVRNQSVLTLAQGLIVTFIFLVISAATEELMFRGFPFQALTHNLGGAVAIGLTAVFFGLAHLGNENASVFSTINTILAGIWLGLAYLITRSLWLAIALHYSWNFAMAFVFGLPVSGITTLSNFSWLRGHPGVPWISGGSYGPEAGAGATVALILSTLVIWKSGWFRASDEMLIAIKHGKREPAIPSVTPEPEPSPATDQPNHRQEPEST